MDLSRRTFFGLLAGVAVVPLMPVQPLPCVPLSTVSWEFPELAAYSSAEIIRARNKELFESLTGDLRSVSYSDFRNSVISLRPGYLRSTDPEEDDWSEEDWSGID